MTIREAESEGAAAAKTLIVDDSRVSGRKLQKAVQALGHEAETASDGLEAMQKLRARSYDIVFLDIVMPSMDGYQVLEAMKADEALRDIPVIVVSSLEDEIGSVARAIELGAEDFLPKDYEVVILKARVNASLSRKRFRDRELDYFRDIDQLTRAAQVIEGGAFRPAELSVDSVAKRSDPLGRLAVVFRGLAEEIYAREKRLDQTIRTLRGTLLVLAAGSIFGLAPALGRMASEISVPPLGLVFWSNLVAAILCLLVSITRNGLPRPGLRDLGFIAIWAVVLGCLYQLLTVVIAGHVEASTIALIGSTRGFMVFLLAAFLALEPPSIRRFVGLGIGFAAIAIVLLANGTGGSDGDRLWLLSALILPLLLSVHTLLMAKRPAHLDASATVGIMMLFSALALLPLASARGSIFLPPFPPGEREAIILVLGVSSAAALVIALNLVSLAGPVFASQMAYSQTLAGIAWGMLLLGESLSPLAWAALAMVILGFWLVEPKKAGEEFRAKFRMRRETP
ncbi:response regulator [Aliiruegeria sabulilitoris]|uniref:response regulator n=1 Tax=Aliiruegeria sabulilitoris TaxID=1510458 RepID=UPI00082AF5EC|nr:response regulator [Aliiruegeria sabulilitoris]NDR55853.1 response regulator [Pseudoruegeria sp. M32A2M]